MRTPDRLPKILYFSADDRYFCMNRLPLARAAQAAGAEVVVATRIDRHGAVIEAAGLRVAPLPLRRGSINPWHELRTLIAIARLYRRERPDLIHHIALKPILYGSLAALLLPRAAGVNTITGLGAVFIGSTPGARRLGRIVRPALRFLLHRRNAWTTVQNPDDRALLVERRIAPAARTQVILGDGIDTQRFAPTPEPPVGPDAPVIAVFVGRMLADKGVRELAEAAHLLQARAVPVRVVLVGPTDPENPAGIPEATLRSWQRDGRLDWRGQVDDIAALWARSHIAVLPSYREGLPNALLEAAACARPLIAADTPGCHEVVRHEETGLLVPARDAAALADAIERLVRDAALRRRLGAAARARVETEYEEPIILRQTLALYGELLPVLPRKAGSQPGSP